MKSKDYCPIYCKGKNLEIDVPIDEDGLVFAKEKDRSWYFSLIGSRPKNPVVALVGLCPGYTQLTSLIEHFNGGDDFLTAASSASFSGVARKNIIKMLKKIGMDKELKISLTEDFDFNSSDLFFTTSLVKCASLKEGKGRSDAYDILKFDVSRRCMINRFVADIKNYSTLKKIIIFGKHAEKALRLPLIEGQSVEDVLLVSGKEVIFLPHPSGANMKSIKEFLA